MMDARAKSGARAPRAKGNRPETAVVKLAQEAGLAAERVPLSGSCGGSYTGDATIPILGVDRIVECKARAAGFSQIYSWLEGRDVLIVKSGRRDALCILPLKLAIEIATAAEHGRCTLRDIEGALAALSLMYREIDEGRRGGPLAAACNIELLHELLTRAETLLDGAKAVLPTP